MKKKNTPIGPTQIQKVVFTLMRDGFMVLGGNHNWHPVAAEVTTLGPFDLGEGYQGFFCVNPVSGRTYVAEALSGGFVGSTIEEVKHDVKTGDRSLMKSQVADALQQAKKAVRIDEKDFWKRLADK